MIQVFWSIFFIHVALGCIVIAGATIKTIVTVEPLEPEVFVGGIALAAVCSAISSACIAQILVWWVL